jgi:hypothetical protein
VIGRAGRAARAARRRAAGPGARIGIIAALAALLAGPLAACSGVPQSSAPKVVRSIGGESTAPPAPVPAAPPSGADPRTIVNQFLANNVSADVRHTAARQYLTADAQKRWQDTSATVVDEIRASNPDPQTGDVVVNARRIGSVAPDGTYTPTLRDPASPDADEVRFAFGMARPDGQWRIDQLPNGLVIAQADFEASYSQFPLYFFDSTEQVLVADLRYTATTGQSLAAFLLAELIGGPRGELSALVNELPDQPTTSNPSITLGSVTDIDLVSVKQLPAATLSKLAIQLAFTLSSRPGDKPVQHTGIGELRLVESGVPVVVPSAGATFSTLDFPAFRPSGAVDPDVLFIRDGAIASSASDGPADPLPGGEGLALTSVAQDRGDEGALAAVGTGPAGDQLYLGADAQSLAPVAGVAGARLTRPTWAAAWGEVWISDGARLWRVGSDGAAVEAAVSARSGSVSGAVVSLRMSRDGGRLALIYDMAGARALWIGAVVRSGADARVEQLTQITPAIGRLDDVAWSDEGALVVAGQQDSGDYGIWTVRVDGSLLAQKTTAGLPPPGDARPLTVTAAPRHFAWLSVADSLWELSGASWSAAMAGPAGSSASTPGSSPAYQD